MTRLLHGAQSAYFADFAVPLDADEFIVAPGRAAFRAVLAQTPPGGFGLVPWRTHVLTAEDLADPAPDPPRSLAWRRAEERPQFHKAILRLDGRLDTDLVLDQGGHSVSRHSGRAVPAQLLPELALAHFPIRSREQMAAKAVVGWMAYLARDPDAARHGLGYHWRGMFERIVRVGGLDDATLCAISQRYAEQPGDAAAEPPALVRADPPIDAVRTLSTGRPLDALVAIARSWERSLAPPASLLRLDRPAALGRSADATGGFDAAWHWDNLFLDTPPFRFIAERLRPTSVLDIGCGIGAYLRLLGRLGAGTVLGLDALPAEATVLGAGEYTTADLGSPIDLGRRFDLVICVEVAEHLDPAREAVLIETIARHADRAIVFSAAEPEQPGHGHVNCRPLGYWLDLWRARGWLPDAVESMAMRALASLSWFRRNLVVLHRAETMADRGGAAALLAIARRRYAWYGQAPGVRDAPFEETPPPEGGYAAG